jgi:PKD repeat protein
MTRKRLLGIVVTFCWGSIALAQGVFSKPAATPKTAGTPCTADLRTVSNAPLCVGLPSVTYDFPIKTYVGRYVDSSYTGDWQVPFRTARAGAIKFASDLRPARVYIRVGSAIAAYNLDTFFTQKLQQTMMPTSMLQDLSFSGVRGLGDAQDSFAPFDQFAYPECKNSGWEIHNVDGQDRLYGFDWDDRGYVYGAYHTFGWGIMRDEGKSDGGQMPFVFQDLSQVAEGIVSLKSGSDYYVMISFNASPTLLYRVTNPQRPELVRSISGQTLDLGSDLGGQIAARNSTRDVLAVTSLNEHKISFYSTAGVAIGTAPQVIQGNFTVTASDGTNFYAAEWASNTLGLSVFTPNGNGTYAQHHYALAGNFQPTSMHANSGYLVIGSQQQRTVLMYKLQNSVPVNIPINDYLSKFYIDTPLGNAHPLRGVLWDAAMYKQNGKVYLLVSYNSLGDVYEIQAGDALSANVLRVGNTPGKPASGARPGPFPGDAVTFNSTITSASMPMVTWDFGNLEAAGLPGDLLANTTNPVPLGSVTHQFSGISSLPANRTVTVKTTDSSADPGQINVSLLAPVPAVRIVRTQLLFTQPNASAPAQIIAGDRFEDASEGAVEGHVASWSLSKTDGTPLTSPVLGPQPPPAGQTAAPSTTAASGPADWGLCGTRTLTFQALYGPYDSGFNALNGFYRPPAIGVSYNVSPFVLGGIVATRNPADSSQINFSTTATMADPTKVLKSGASGNWTVTWQQNGSAVQTKTEAIGTISPLIVNKSAVMSGTVGLLVTIAPADVVAPCDSYAAGTQSLSIVTPAPVLSGSCDTPQACSVSDITTSDVSPSVDPTWTYAWTVDGVSRSETGKTLSLAGLGLAMGPHLISLSVVNTFGGPAVASTAVTVKTPACNNTPTADTVTISYFGQTSHCSSGGCTAGEAITFSRGSYYNYPFGNCDKYDWDFGDGPTHSTLSGPTHTYAGTGPYTVTLKLDGGTGFVALTPVSVTFGYTPPPPPPPPPPGTCSPPNPAAVTLSYYGSTSRCSYNGPACVANETIQFQAASPYVGIFNPSCDRYDWNFGDNTPHGNVAAPTHAYTTAASYTVTLNLNGTTFTIPVGFGAGPPPPPPPGSSGCNGTPNESNVSVSYAGTSGTCYSGGRCNPGESITFTLGTYGYSFLACDTFDWQFGDGQISSARNPTHVFPTTNTSYNVQVKITSGSNSVTLHTTVSFGSQAVNETVDFSYPGMIVATGTVVTFQVLPPANTKAIQWRWDFGDHNTATTNNKTVTNTYLTAGTYPVTVFALDSAGNILAQKTHAITAVKPSRHRGAHSGG